MVDIRFSVLVAEFEGEDSTRMALKKLQGQHDYGAITIQDAAVIRKDVDSQLQVLESTNSSNNGAAIGLLAGAAIALIGGPTGIAAWSAAGAATSKIAAGLHARGICNDQLRQVGHEITPGSSALVLVIDPTSTITTEKSLVTAGARVFTTSIAGETAEQIYLTASEAINAHLGIYPDQAISRVQDKRGETRDGY